MTEPAAQSLESYRRVAAAADVPFVRLANPGDATSADREPVNPLAVRLLPDAVHRQFGILAIAYRDGVVTVAVTDPGDRIALETAAAITARQVRVVVAPAQDIERVAREVFEASPECVAEEREPPAAPARGDASASSRRGPAAAEVDERELVARLAEQLDLPLLELEGYEPDAEALAAIPESVVRDLGCVPLEADEETLYLAASDVLTDRMSVSLRAHTALRPYVLLAPPSSIRELVARVYEQEPPRERATDGPEGRRRWRPWRR